MVRNCNHAKKTAYTTVNCLRIYDLRPQETGLPWALAGPDKPFEMDPSEVDLDNLPPGWRFIDSLEWGDAVMRAFHADPVRVAANEKLRHVTDCDDIVFLFGRQPRKDESAGLWWVGLELCLTDAEVETYLALKRERDDLKEIKD